MTTPLWMKADSALDADMMRFMAGEDIALDQELLPFDLRATIAHVQGLAEIGALTEKDAHALCEALRTILDDVRSGRLILDEQFEDCHSAIEAWLTARVGEAGARVHLGRSRNDQVLIAARLHLIDSMRTIRRDVILAGEASVRLARRHEWMLMPGYTHMQRAVPSTVGLWMASFAESFADDAAILGSTIDWISASPLGTAAGYGVNLPLARESAREALGFDRLLVNPMHAQASRGKFEAQALMGVWQAMQTVRRLGWDVTLFASAEFGFVSLPAGATTGSSIMPNKTNPDVAELLRGSASVVAGSIAELQQTLSLPSGYHRDLQLTKGPTLRALRTARRALSITARLIDGLRFDEARLRAAIEPAMLATDRAVELARDGTPFREAYRQVAREQASLTLGEHGAVASVRARVSPGACADLKLDTIEARLRRLASTCARSVRRSP